jgi:hypothetical protein
MNTSRLDLAEAYKWWDVLRDGNQLTEIRLISNDGKTASGIFDNIDVLINAITPFTDDWNIYYTMNRLPDDVKGLPQYNKIIVRPKQTCNDNTVVARDYVCVDLDSVRLSGTNATDEQIEFTKKTANALYKYLIDVGFNPPIVVFSGNGVHIYIRCAMLNNEKNTKLVKRFLHALAMMFTDEYTDVDTAVFNAARIMRLPSSFSCKGNRLDKTRPQRLCKFVKIPQEIKINDTAYFEKVAELYPEENTRPNASNNYSSDKFDLATFISKYNIEVDKIQKVAGGTKYLLKACPWNPDHRSPDSMLFQRDNGAVSFFCYHSSCQDKHWADFRKLYEPDYQKNTSFIPNNRYKYAQQKIFEPIKKTDEKGEVWVKMSDIKRPRLDVSDYIPSGIEQIDKLIIGFKRKQVSLWSGYRGCGKSSILNMLILNAAQQGYKTALWTGELDGSEVKQWLYLQAAGKTFNKKSQFTDFYYTPDSICDKIDPWIDKYLFLFNNEYGENYKQLEYEIRTLKKEQDIDVVMLDSLMVLDYDDLDGDRNEKQKNLMRMITKLAKELNIHIHMVCHPNKSGTFLRVNNISGSGHIPDYAQYIFICHRLGLDFTKNAQDFLSPITISEITDSRCSNCIEICKCRDKGSAVDKFIKLHFEMESNRLKNSIAEHIVYGWQEEPTQVRIEYNESSESEPIEPFDAFEGEAPF